MTRRPSVARALQLVADDQDDKLTTLVRARRPGVRHWWGRRAWPVDIDDQTQGRPGQGYVGEDGLLMLTGAWCYLCDEPIATWSSRWPMTEAARAAVAVHRDKEVRRLLDGPAHHAVEERP